MLSPCIHGFSADQCASCRTCPHGLVTGRCGRCAAGSTAARRPARRTTTAAQPVTPVEDHLGYEIFYVPAVCGWQYRDPDARPSPLSYRSAFLARKAVDQLPTRVTAKLHATADTGP